MSDQGLAMSILQSVKLYLLSSVQVHLIPKGIRDMIRNETLEF